jgi:hypothetical protein
LALLFVVTTYVAVSFGGAAMGPVAGEIFLSLVTLAFFIAVATVAWKKSRAKRTHSQES